MSTYSILFLNLNRRFYKLVTVTSNPNHQLKYIYIQRNETQKKPQQIQHVRTVPIEKYSCTHTYIHDKHFI
jgi:hypothetical protein